VYHHSGNLRIYCCSIWYVTIITQLLELVKHLELKIINKYFAQKEVIIVQFAQNLTELMEKRNLSAYRVSKDTGLSDSLIGYYRSGKNEPSLENLTKLAEYFDVPISELSGSPNLIDTYVRGIKSWANNKFFTEDETERIEEHLANVLLRYKDLVNLTCDLRMGKGEEIDVEEIKKATEQKMYSLLTYILIAPAHFFGKYNPFDKVETDGDSYAWKKVPAGENSIQGDVSGSAFVQGVNKGNVTVHNGREHSISEEAAELLKLYEGMNFKKRIKLSQLAIDLSESED
jgi:transcriptional regulator with XRE-family HTH domain